jgi:hypothetical protein
MISRTGRKAESDYGTRRTDRTVEGICESFEANIRMATYENDGHFCRLPIKDERVFLSCPQRDYDRKNDEKQCCVRPRIGRSFEHDGSPEMEILNLFTGSAAIF